MWVMCLVVCKPQSSVLVSCQAALISSLDDANTAAFISLGTAHMIRA